MLYPEVRHICCVVWREECRIGGHILVLAPDSNLLKSPKKKVPNKGSFHVSVQPNQQGFVQTWMAAPQGVQTQVWGGAENLHP